MIVKGGEVKDVMLLRKASVAFTNITVKGYVGHRFDFVNNLKSDMLREHGIPTDCKTQVQDSMETWNSALDKFETFSAKADDWTVELGVSMTNVLLNMASELEVAHTAMSQVWDAGKKARKVEQAAAIKRKSTMDKASNEALRPFIKNGLDSAWKALLFRFKLVTTGHVLGHAASQPAVLEETTTVVDWSNPHYWLTIEVELPEDKQGLRKYIIHMAYTRNTHGIHVSYACHIHVRHMSDMSYTWYTHGVHLEYTREPHFQANFRSMSDTCQTHVTHGVRHISYMCLTLGIHMSYMCHTLAIHMSYTWHTLGIHVSYTWHTLGIHMSYTCFTLGIHTSCTGSDTYFHMADRWHTHVRHMSFSCQTHVIHMAYTWNTPGIHMGTTFPGAFQEHVRHMSHTGSDTCHTYGLHMTYTWNAHGTRMKHTWHTHGMNMVWSWKTHQIRKSCNPIMCSCLALL